MKYQMPISIYPLNVYPNYAYGNTYVVSADVVSCLTNSAGNFPYFRIEDAFITGVLARHCNVSHIHVKGFSHSRRKALDRSALLQGEDMTFFNIPPKVALVLWNNLKQHHKAAEEPLS